MSRRSATVKLLVAQFGDQPFTVQQARAAQIEPHLLLRAAQLGRIVRLSRGRYVVPPEDSRSLHLAQVRAAMLGHEGLVAAGVSAAAVWRLPCPNPLGDWSRLPVTIAGARSTRVPSRSRLLQLGGRRHTVVEGTPATDLLSTAVDVAWQLPEPQALMVVDAIAARFVGRADRNTRASARGNVRQVLLGAVADIDRRQRRGRIRQVMQWADPCADSPPESCLRGHLLLAGASPPAVNAPMRGASGRIYYPDLSWPQRGVVVEVDGKLKYATNDALVAEKRREDDLRAAGLMFRRVEAWDALAYGAFVASRLMDLVGRC